MEALSSKDSSLSSLISSPYSSPNLSSLLKIRSWDDTLIVLQRSQSLLPCVEDLLIVSHCIESLAFIASPCQLLRPNTNQPLALSRRTTTISADAVDAPPRTNCGLSASPVARRARSSRQSKSIDEPDNLGA
ncbi:hypothetical protein Dimus_029046 [Dionaea muscipula]